MAKFVVTGGHHNSALVLAQYLVAKGHQVYWYGHRYSSRGNRHDSAEYVEVTNSKLPFFDLPAGRALLNLSELFKLPLGFFVALKYLWRHQPQAVISFGGYLGATTCLAAVLLKRPIYLHEQTVVAGKANRFLGLLARRIYLTWQSSRRYFPHSRALVVGLPLRPSLLSAKSKPFFTRTRPTLLIMGGKQGAHALNNFVFANLSALLTHFNLIHQTGLNSETGDDARAQKLKLTLGSLADCYLPISYITEAEIGSYLRAATYYLGRSGAHITYELLLLRLKAILVPLTHTHQTEQLKNARELVRVGQGIILSQTHLTLNNVLEAVTTLRQAKPVSSLTLPRDATEKIYEDLIATL